MKLPLQITFRNMDPSEALEANIRKKAEKLDQVCDQIMSCRVIFEQHHKHHQQGNLFHVRVDLTVPGKEFVVNRDPKNQAHEDAYVAVRDAFAAAQRQLEKYNQQRQQHVKHHELPPQGRVLELFPAEDYGRIATADGREIYFHRNSLLDGDFDRLEVGTAVAFVEEVGEQGPQASTVRLISEQQAVI